MTSTPHIIRYAIVIADLEYPTRGTVGMVTDHPFDNMYDQCTFLPLGAKTPVQLRNDYVERKELLWQPPAGAIAATRIEYRTLMQFGLDAANGTDQQDAEWNKFIAEGWELVQIGNPVVVIYDNIPAMYRQIILRRQG